MRVVGGRKRGTLLIGFDREEVRPTLDRGKESMFNIIQFDIEGRTVLDLFAGSGQLGIEALSRGADYAVFVDKSQTSIDHITQNIKNTGFEDKSKVIRGDYSAVLMGMNTEFDYVFLDPPYASDFLIKALSLVQKCVKDHGLIICEHPKEQELPSQVGEFVLKKAYRYGKIVLSVYHRKGEENE